METPLYDSVVTRRSISPAVRVNGTVNGAAVNLGTTGADSAIVVVLTGTITDGSHAVTIEDSADGSTGWAAVPAGQIRGTLPTIISTDDDTQFEVGITPSKQYLRVVVVTTGATTGGAFAAAVVVKGDTSPVVH